MQGTSTTVIPFVQKMFTNRSCRLPKIHLVKLFASSINKCSCCDFWLLLFVRPIIWPHHVWNAAILCTCFLKKFTLSVWWIASHIYPYLMYICAWHNYSSWTFLAANILWIGTGLLLEVCEDTSSPWCKPMDFLHVHVNEIPKCSIMDVLLKYLAKPSNIAVLD